MTVRTTTTAAASTLGATWTTTTRTAATTTTYPQVPQYRHGAHRLAASCINRNTQHDRDNSNLANHKASTTARTAPATAQQTQKFKQTRKTNSLLFLTHGGLPIHADRKVVHPLVSSYTVPGIDYPRCVTQWQSHAWTQQHTTSCGSSVPGTVLDLGRFERYSDVAIDH